VIRKDSAHGCDELIKRNKTKQLAWY